MEHCSYKIMLDVGIQFQAKKKYSIFFKKIIFLFQLLNSDRYQQIYYLFINIYNSYLFSI